MHVKSFAVKRAEVEVTLAELDRRVNEYLRVEVPGQQISLSAPVVFGSHLVVVGMFSGGVRSTEQTSTPRAAEPTEGDFNLKRAIAGVERSLVTQALARAENNAATAAKLLGISERALQVRIAGLVEGE